jgi:hypothetical protein
MNSSQALPRKARHTECQCDQTLCEKITQFCQNRPKYGNFKTKSRQNLALILENLGRFLNKFQKNAPNA